MSCASCGKKDANWLASEDNRYDFCGDCLDVADTWLQAREVPDTFFADRNHAYIDENNDVWVLSHDRGAMIKLNGGSGSASVDLTPYLKINDHKDHVVTSEKGTLAVTNSGNTSKVDLSQNLLDKIDSSVTKDDLNDILDSREIKVEGALGTKTIKKGDTYYVIAQHDGMKDVFNYAQALGYTYAGKKYIRSATPASVQMTDYTKIKQALSTGTVTYTNTSNVVVLTLNGMLRSNNIEYQVHGEYTASSYVLAMNYKNSKVIPFNVTVISQDNDQKVYTGIALVRINLEYIGDGIYRLDVNETDIRYRNMVESDGFGVNTTGTNLDELRQIFENPTYKLHFVTITSMTDQVTVGNGDTLDDLYRFTHDIDGGIPIWHI